MLGQHIFADLLALGVTCFICDGSFIDSGMLSTRVRDRQWPCDRGGRARYWGFEQRPGCSLCEMADQGMP